VRGFSTKEEDSMKHITAADHTRLSYRIVGEGKTPVLLVHGWMVSGAVFDPLIDALDRTDLRLIVPDLRGSGLSDKPTSGYTLATFADDLAAILEAEGKPAILVGHSMGGQLVQLLAATRPELVSAAAVLCSVPAAGMPLPADAAGLFRTCAGNRGAQGTILDIACKQLSPVERERLLDLGAATAAASIEQAFDAWTGGGFAERIPTIRAPFLVVATDDPFLPPDLLRSTITSLIPGARQVYLPGPGHYPQCERPAEVAAILGAFFAGAPRA
jgi:pimeloyl-ACP methyl ester carboxylesterase